MFRNRLYYRLKPLIPRPVRLQIRRRLVRRQLRNASGKWPILEGSQKPPADWRGWPENRKFAFVLTHDVEGRRGLDNVMALAELEASLGFRSSFNFVPEGEYRVSDDMRRQLEGEGFEVGVHDLHHDGHLYASERAFASNARRINAYLSDWNAQGFRSAFMLHRLEWLHALDIRYDMSIFDTDPFEPESDGCGTIFPFAVPQGRAIDTARSVLDEPGYVELPYTLPQDSTLFLLLAETSPRIWKEKFEWVAGHGGMALLNVHPDYIAANDPPRAGRTYPMSVYRDFLLHVRDFQFDQCWQALPREVSDHCRASAAVCRQP